MYSIVLLDSYYHSVYNLYTYIHILFAYTRSFIHRHAHNRPKDDYCKRICNVYNMNAKQMRLGTILNFDSIIPHVMMLDLTCVDGQVLFSKQYC